MRAKEFIVERKGTLNKDHNRATPGAYKFMDNGTDRIYNLNQVMKAAAMADGSNKPIEMDHESFAGKNNMAYPYTELEHNMMKQAFKTVTDSNVHNVVKDHHSLEPKDTHKVSPVRKNKHVYGKSK